MTFPDPEPGLVISYRPCAIVLAMAPDAGVPEGRRVVVLPITHTLPMDADAAIELPHRVKRHLGLDDAPSWVVLDELNVFVWPGFDLRHLPGKPGQYAYGYLPPRFFDQLRDSLRERRAQRRLRVVSRE